MQREKHNFEIDLTPTVKMTFLKGGVKVAVAAAPCMFLL